MDKLIHKEKEPKRNPKGKALSLKERVAQKNIKVKRKGEQMAKESQKDRKQQLRVRSRKNAEIDERLLSLVMEGLIDEDYWKFHTKCVYVLGIQKYNQLVIESREGKKPKHLLAFKLKGALELHYKKQIFKKQYGIED